MDGAAQGSDRGVPRGEKREEEENAHPTPDWEDVKDLCVP